MIVNFFLDNRVGGPHKYSKQIGRHSNKKFVNVTCGLSEINSISITNLRKYSKYLFLIEIIINFFEVIFLFKKKKYNYFYIFSILNFAPVLSGLLLRKQVKWFIIEEPNYYTKFFFKIINNFDKLEVITVSNFIAKNLSIKNYSVIKPKINTSFWKKKIKCKKKKN